MKPDRLDLGALIGNVRAGELEAYGTIVRSFQDMAVGYAYSILEDFHLAEDAAEEAFVTAYLDLSNLREVAAFPGWLRRIVFKQCDRLTRGKKVRSVPLEARADVASQDPDPASALEAREMRDAVLGAIQRLPEHEREATTLFYINGYTQNEIGEFLGVPSKTIRSRLHSARNRLRERMMDMVKEHLHEQRPSRHEDFAVKVMGDLVELADREVQVVLSKFGVQEIAIALQGEKDDLKERIFANMSVRVQSLLDEQMSDLGEVSAEETEAVRERIIDAAQEAIAAVRKMKEKSGASPSVAEVKAELQATPFDRLQPEAIAELIRDLAAIARRDGILVLGEVANATDTDEEMLRQGINLAVDGTEPELIQAILEVRAPTLARHHETRYRMIVEGILSIRWNDHPFIINQRLRNCYISTEYAEPTGASLQELKDRLGDAPASQLDLEGLRLLIVDMAAIARREKSVEALADLVDCIDEDLLSSGLQMAVEGQEEGQIREALKARIPGLLENHRTRYRLVMEGILLIQGGCKPEEVVEKMRALYDSER